MGASAHGRFYTYVLNNIDLVIPIIYSQKYVLFEIMYTFSLEIASFHSYHMVQGSYIWDFKYSDR